MNKNSINVREWLIAIILIGIIVILLINKLDIKVNSGRKLDIESLKSKTSINIELPNFILNKDNLEITTISNQLVTLGCEEFVLKIAPFIDLKADILGLYENSKEDVMYISNNNNSGIKYIRYRLGYENYPNSALLNWYTETTSYGCIIGKTLTIEEALKFIDIDKQNIELYVNDKDTDNSKNNNKEYELSSLGIELKLPKFKSELNILEYEDIAYFYMNKKLIFIITNSTDESKVDNFNGEEELKINDVLTIKYLSSNPFNLEDIAYNDYNTFMHTVNDIALSIVYQ